MEKMLYRPAEVAEICAVGRTTIFEAMRSGRLESVRIGAARRVPREALLAFVEALREPAPR